MHTSDGSLPTVAPASLRAAPCCWCETCSDSAHFSCRLLAVQKQKATSSGVIQEFARQAAGGKRGGVSNNWRKIVNKHVDRSGPSLSRQAHESSTHTVSASPLPQIGASTFDGELCPTWRTLLRGLGTQRSSRLCFPRIPSTAKPQPVRTPSSSSTKTLATSKPNTAVPTWNHFPANKETCQRDLSRKKKELT